ncbi:IS3 family transposase [Sporomusa termitida]|uniref:IS3 family transposase n=1 Tax=Sporomusa termitida TaxID=2377 RepID=UPI001FE3D74E|nr:IS3 family transposase [Sporomusa termitida]
MKQFSAEFKLQAVKRVEATGGPVSKVAAELGINENTLHGWLKKYREKPNAPFPGSGKLSPDDERLRKLERENRDLREENEILKKAGSVLREEPEIKRFKFIKANRQTYRVEKLCKVLGVSRSGYYAWENRPKSQRDLENEAILAQIEQLHQTKRHVYGCRKIYQELRRKGLRVNHKRIERLMKQAGIHSKTAKIFKATTNSKHALAVAENLLNREFTASRPNQKMVSDITYLWTEEGWLYVAAIIDLCGQRVVGLSMSERMTKELVMQALDSVCKRARPPHGVLIHSDRGSQYCSKDYQDVLKERGFICSMSRKGNCWDNAPMEAFWGKMKYEWLIGQRFQTREQARAAVFEYVEIFYNRQRIHATNGYRTPEEYYLLAMAA